MTISNFYSFPANRTEQDLIHAVNLANEKMPRKSQVNFFPREGENLLKMEGMIFGAGLFSGVVTLCLKVFRSVFSTEIVKSSIVKIISVIAKSVFRSNASYDSSVIRILSSMDTVLLYSIKGTTTFLKVSAVVAVIFMTVILTCFAYDNYHNKIIEKDNKLIDRVITAIKESATRNNTQNEHIIEVNHSMGAGKWFYLLKVGNQRLEITRVNN
jgi:hypothetical protein